MTDKNKTIPLRRQPLNMNGLRGYAVKLSPMPHARGDVLMVGGDRPPELYHELITFFHRYAQVTVPSLPGFDGAEGLWTLRQRPSIDALADYLAAFVKLRYKRRRFAIVGVSFGFVVATRMLQRYPEFASKVAFVVNAGGIVHASSRPTSKSESIFAQVASVLVGLPFATRLLRKRMTYLVSGSHIPSSLHTHNDVRTVASLRRELLDLDNCHQPVPLHAWYINTADPAINEQLVEQHMRVVYGDVSPLMALGPAVRAQQLPATFKRTLRTL